MYQGPPAETLKRKHDLERSHAELEEVITAIQRRPEVESKAIFDRIRAGADAQSILRQIRYGDILLQLHLESETRYRYDFPYQSDLPDLLGSMENLISVLCFTRALVWALLTQPSSYHLPVRNTRLSTSDLTMLQESSIRG